ncbi:hypothetical protein GGH17_004279, partial [Coemansia sp. RSA 788]
MPNKKGDKPKVLTDAQKRRQRRDEEVKIVEDLGQRALALASAGPLSSDIKLFSELPISEKTQQ